ncbi:MAG TPA: acetolactate synthase small subunit [Spirochaetota bacterium]|jgi:acetolactate synthase-1/3 small subunit|nr:acetolactate synthase small subunit [Spirochaetota bacterium]HOH37783.1 acetolactate synthase small subunit [Spirochaetota bacterium]HPJ16097.1 acetolactate synthase small subunit [Spirochaetota bacterium]HPM33223.1 acetolactate synthase small subunit [Spirochaetota bacterium]HPW52163.1 acetolactate synthase small subunit [Spirochaetota bacterium]
MSQHVLSVKVENQSGVLARVVNLFSARGYNIDSLSVSKTEDEDISCITVVVNGDDRVIEQVKKQLNKLIDIIKVTDQPKEYSFQREIVMLKLQLTSSKRIEIFQIAQTFKASILDITQKSITLEYLGSPEQLDIFIEILRPYGIKELNRSGRISFPKD